MKTNSILIALLVFMVLTSLFWFQVLRIRDLPTPKPKDNPVISGAEAESFVKMAQTLLINYKTPLPEISGRDPFYKDYLVQIPVVEPKIEKVPSDIFIVSSVIYDKSNPLAVINGRILSEGDKISNRELDSDFMIENISLNEVKINNGHKKYVLKTMTSKQ